MTHRFTSWWRVLCVVLLGLATVTWPSAARADTSVRVTIVHQNALATLSAHGFTHFATTLRLSPGSARATVTIYPRLVARSQIEPIVAGQGTSAAPLASTGSIPLACRHDGEVTFSITLLTGPANAALRSCHGVAPRLRFTCAGACDGVYPLRYQVSVNGLAITTWSLLALKATTVEHPLRVVLLETLTRTSLQHPKRSIAVLHAIGTFASSPLTLSADYESLAAIDYTTNDAAAWKVALDAALASPLHRAVDAPPGSIDFAGLVENGLTTQVPEQLNLSANLLRALTGRYVDDQILLTGAQSPASLLALAGAGVHDIVVPEGDLSVAPSSTLTWGAPFHVTGAGSLTALSVDQPLSALLADTGISPGRRAALALATLAFLHFEEPNEPATRTVVLESPVGSTSRVFVADLLAGLHNDPFGQLAPLGPSFNSSLIGTDGAPVERDFNTTFASSIWSRSNVTSLRALIGDVNSYAQAIKSGDEPLVLHVAVARTEIVANADQRQGAINAATSQLDAQLRLFSIDSSAITLAGVGTTLPVTVISHAPYKVDAVVHLVTDRLSFPKGSAVPVDLTSPTQSIRVATANPRGSSLTLQVVLSTPNDQVVLARTAVQVRVAGTSVVGYVLTFASLFVLGLWWWRTNRRRPKGRHAR